MSLATLPGRYVGFDATTAAKLAHEAAIRDAVSITALSGSVYFPTEFIIDEVQRQLLDKVTSFAIHARRALEIANLRGIQIEGGRWRFVAPPPELKEERNLWDAINKIIHARHLQVYVFQRSPSEIFLGPGFEWVLMHLEVQSDREKVHVSPFGLAYSYLNGVVGHFNPQHGTT
jgi:hypothetical protein